MSAEDKTPEDVPNGTNSEKRDSDQEGNNVVPIDKGEVEPIDIVGCTTVLSAEDETPKYVTAEEEGKDIDPVLLPEIIEAKPEGIVGCKTVDVNDCPVVSVVVYLDRAEVCRSLKHDAKRGDNEFILQNLSNLIDEDSIRVEGLGDATILEVTFSSRFIPNDVVAIDTRVSGLEEELMVKRADKKVLTDTRARLQKPRDVLDGIANNIMCAGGTKDKDGNTASLCSMLESKMLEGVQSFFSMYESQAERLDTHLQQLETDVEKLEKEIVTIEENIYTAYAGKDGYLSRECSIIVDVKEDDEIKLLFFYIVKGAKWYPKYDIRVFSKDKKMTLMYFGMVEQKTGEEWKDAKICLSTATPSIGGQVPSLGTNHLSLKSKMHRLWEEQTPISICEQSHNMSYKMRASPVPPKPQMQHPVAQIQEGMSSSTFEIVRKCTIPSDGQGHRVSIGIIDLAPTFEYESVPQKAAQAYLKAKVKNTSGYALLSGPTNIFLDNTFIAKSELKSVSPEEEFVCSLGVDLAVKVTYHPLHMYREQAGIINKTITMVYRQEIEVKNTRAYNIKMLVTEQLPKSLDNKIKVKLLEPNLKEDKKGKEREGDTIAKLNMLNNIEWETEIPAGESHAYRLCYTIEYPANEEIQSNV